MVEYNCIFFRYSPSLKCSVRLSRWRHLWEINKLHVWSIYIIDYFPSVMCQINSLVITTENQHSVNVDWFLGIWLMLFLLTVYVFVTRIGIVWVIVTYNSISLLTLISLFLMWRFSTCTGLGVSHWRHCLSPRIIQWPSYFHKPRQTHNAPSCFLTDILKLVNYSSWGLQCKT